MATNYPIIELKSGIRSSLFRPDLELEQHRRGHRQYAGDNRFHSASRVALGTYSLTVIANGISSDPVSFTGGWTGADLAVAQQDRAACTE